MSSRPTERHRISTVLAVCVGNVCRSPLTEQILASRIKTAGIAGVELLSAGLGALAGAPMEPWPAALSRENGGDPQGAVGKKITAEMVDAADLILTMSRKQRDEFMSRYPHATRRTFTLAEFARLLGELPQGDAGSSLLGWPDPGTSQNISGIRVLATSAAAVRHKVQLSGADDVPDPMGRSEALHRDVARQIAALSESIVDGLAARFRH
ncbi:hypothetical protein [Paenarthrobacter ureafaciens]|uniref:arsenate reductase/protein-tyrosine-phosphatase family protein n=1 Tax=Paenarthrobacter ureafaciens TaxID=37931 RepID=UPI0009AD2F94|nr:hypothetical protein [Paenarthrobacter ureafaciens]GLU61382.1 low molecular weight phosphatase family protein [Paenarthrobacter ureafaciens]GLU65672.1 low molecular weight phosphatase family protein [Paenarthrobacter ureafaciens]GLU69985.1 low molecular weight phosphatase family protein [Paenarthrobacter ureafaciens]GLU74232.1 low molecular weight phosphatase family protein [Paenarthrobacter ureafaciens]GLU78453.1 low molecular weight phosphatase family protein [Paenarthrobacter ureafaciens